MKLIPCESTCVCWSLLSRSGASALLCCMVVNVHLLCSVSGMVLLHGHCLSLVIRACLFSLFCFDDIHLLCQLSHGIVLVLFAGTLALHAFRCSMLCGAPPSKTAVIDVHNTFAAGAFFLFSATLVWTPCARRKRRIWSVNGRKTPSSQKPFQAAAIPTFLGW